MRWLKNVQKVQTQFVRGADHRTCDIRRDKENFALFFCENGGARGDAIEYRNFACAVPQLNEIGK